MADHTGAQRIRGYCGLCVARCGTVATVKDGRFTRLEPDPSHPTGQAICAKGRAASELVYHPARLTYPLRRTWNRWSRSSGTGGRDRRESLVASSWTQWSRSPGTRNCSTNKVLPAMALVSALVFAASQNAPASAEEQIFIAKNGDARLRVFSEGSGPEIVLLPGQGRGPRDLDTLSTSLVSAGFRVLRPEPRGFGESVGPVDGATLRDNAADVAAAIEASGSARAIVAGWAYGNRVARMLATERPQLVRGVVLIAAGGKFAPAPGVFQSLQAYQDKSLPIEKRAEIGRAILYGPNTNISIADMRIDDVSAATIRAQSVAPSPSTPVESWWAGGKAPMLVLQGLHDVIAPPENGRSLKQDYPDRVTLVEFPDLGHAMARERPDLVSNAIVAWVAKLSK